METGPQWQEQTLFSFWSKTKMSKVTTVQNKAKETRLTLHVFAAGIFSPWD